MMLRTLAVQPRDLAQVRSARVEIFVGRSRHAWPPGITNWPDWHRPWRNLCERERIDISLDDAIAAVQIFATEIDSAR